MGQCILNNHSADKNKTSPIIIPEYSNNIAANANGTPSVTTIYLEVKDKTNVFIDSIAFTNPGVLHDLSFVCKDELGTVVYTTGIVNVASKTFTNIEFNIAEVKTLSMTITNVAHNAQKTIIAKNILIS